MPNPYPNPYKTPTLNYYHVVLFYSICPWVCSIHYVLHGIHEPTSPMTLCYCSLHMGRLLTLRDPVNQLLLVDISTVVLRSATSKLERGVVCLSLSHLCVSILRACEYIYPPRDTQYLTVLKQSKYIPVHIPFT